MNFMKKILDICKVIGLIFLCLIGVGVSMAIVDAVVVADSTTIDTASVNDNSMTITFDTDITVKNDRIYELVVKPERDLTISSDNGHSITFSNKDNKPFHIKVYTDTMPTFLFEHTIE